MSLFISNLPGFSGYESRLSALSKAEEGEKDRNTGEKENVVEHVGSRAQ
jgi:hypothetical protein